MQCIHSRKHIYLLNFSERYGAEFFKSNQVSTSLEDVKEMVIRLHTKMTPESVPADTNLDNPDDPGTPPAISNENDLLEGEDPEKDFDSWAHKLYRSLSSNRTDNSSPTPEPLGLSPIALEMAKFDQKEVVDIWTGAVAQVWWQDRSRMYPILHNLSCMLLSIPPSSIESERIFSRGSIIYHPRRNRLGPKTAERLMFLNYNLRFLDKHYSFDAKTFQRS